MKREVGEEGQGLAQAGSFILRLFSLSLSLSLYLYLYLYQSLSLYLSPLQAGILGEISGEGFSRMLISSPGVSFQGHGLH